MIVKLHDGTKGDEPGCTVRSTATDGRCLEHAAWLPYRPVGSHVQPQEPFSKLRKTMVLR